MYAHTVPMAELPLSVDHLGRTVLAFYDDSQKIRLRFSRGVMLVVNGQGEGLSCFGCVGCELFIQWLVVPL